MFGRLEAALYFTRLLQFDECYLRPEHLSSCGVFFTVHPGVQHVRPSTVIVGRPAWLLDCRLRNYGPVVPQTIWTAGDSERFCNVPLNMPILFLHCQFGAPGLRVSRAAAGNDLSGIMYGRAPAPVGNGCWTSIRINVSVSVQVVHRVATVRIMTPSSGLDTKNGVAKLGSEISHKRKIQSPSKHWRQPSHVRYANP